MFSAIRASGRGAALSLAGHFEGLGCLDIRGRGVLPASLANLSSYARPGGGCPHVVSGTSEDARAHIRPDASLSPADHLME